MENRRILANVKLTLQDGSEVDTPIYGIGHWEKSQIVKKHSKNVFDQGHHYSVRDSTEIMDDMMKIAFKDIDFKLLPDNAVDIYQEIVNPEKHEKKEKTFVDGQTDTG